MTDSEHVITVRFDETTMVATSIDLHNVSAEMMYAASNLLHFHADESYAMRRLAHVEKQQAAAGLAVARAVPMDHLPKHRSNGQGR